MSVEALAVPIGSLPLPAAYADPAFRRCLGECIRMRELVANFERLTGSDLRRQGDLRRFVEFVHGGVYLRLSDEAIAALRVPMAAA